MNPRADGSQEGRLSPRRAPERRSALGGRRSAEPAVDRAFIDLHCHTSASFDSLTAPQDVVRAAADRGLTHLAITDHDRLDGALEARVLAPAGLTVIVGEEIRTLAGDLIALFVREPIPPWLPAVDAISEVRRQGGLVGMPHPFDRLRGSVGRDAAMASLAPLVDWVEVHNARLVGRGNDAAIEYARANGLPGVAVSDAHTAVEIGVAYTVLHGDPSTPHGLLASLQAADVVVGRAPYVVRLATPLATLVQRVRGNRRPRRGSAARASRP